jgi:hypothetical protein
MMEVNESAIGYLSNYLYISPNIINLNSFPRRFHFFTAVVATNLRSVLFLFASAQEIAVLCLFALGQNQPSSTVSLFLLLSGQQFSKLPALLRAFLDYKAPAPVFEHAGPTITSQEHVHIQSNSICDVMSRTARENRRAS